MANLSDRGAVEAVAARIDWKYALGLELSDSSFDSSVLTLFRSRLLNGGKEKLVLDKLLERCQQLKLLKSKGKARTDSTHILAAIRNLNRLEYVGNKLLVQLESKVPKNGLYIKINGIIQLLELNFPEKLVGSASFAIFVHALKPNPEKLLYVQKRNIKLLSKDENSKKLKNG